jgi:small subunit ribosomal protein S5
MASEDKDTKKETKKAEVTEKTATSPKVAEASKVSEKTSQSGRTPMKRTFTNDRTKGKFNKKQGRNNDELEKRIVTIRRVSHTYKGGKRMSLSVLVVVGDRKGKVGAAMGKGADVRSAETKAYNKAKKNMVEVKLHNTTIPHEVFHKKGAVMIFMKPAAPGTGVIAGASMRSVLELVGVKDILTKIIGAPNPITNVYATIEALQSTKS